MGDIESTPYLEAVRQLRWELGKNSLCVHLTYVPYLKAAKELKTKPTQHSVKLLQQVGIQPDVLVLRTEKDIPIGMRRKVAQFCNVEPSDAVIQSIDAPTIYQVPLLMHEQHLDEIVLRKMDITPEGEPDLTAWNAFLHKLSTASEEVNIGLVGKYVQLQDAYKSINESLSQAAVHCGRKLNLTYVNSEKLSEDNAGEHLKDLDGVVIAPGFGQRGIEGKFHAIKWTREHDVPTFGICLGMQCMVIEFARNVLCLEEANSTEMDTKTPTTSSTSWRSEKHLQHGGTYAPRRIRMRAEAGFARGRSIRLNTRQRTPPPPLRIQRRIPRPIRPRRRMRCVGTNPETGLVEVVEIPEKRWFIGTQYHPEYQSTVLHPNPLFISFIKAAVAYREDRK